MLHMSINYCCLFPVFLLNFFLECLCIQYVYFFLLFESFARPNAMNIELCINYVDNGHPCPNREGNLDANGAELRSSPQEATSVTETRQSNHLRSPSVTLEQKNHLKFNPAQILFRRAYSVSFGRRGRESLTPASSYNVGGASTSQNRLDVEGALTASSDECDALSRISSRGSLLSTCCPSGIVNFCLVPLVIDDGCEIESELSTRLELKEELCPSSPPSVLV